MSPRFRIALYATVSVAGLIGPRASFAQSDQPAAQPSAGSGLEEIVVTARRREERVQTIPLAVTALSQTALEQHQIKNVSDLTKIAPGVGVQVASSDQNGNYPPVLRLRGLQGTVIYLAEVPIAGDQGYGLSHGPFSANYYDLADVEIIKGPQGTLFGRPSIGGLISIQPQRPTNDWEGYIKTTFGNYGNKENEFALNIPIIQDKVLLRIGGQMQERDGYTRDVSNGVDLDNQNHYAWRVGLTIRPTDDLENYLFYDGYWQDQAPSDSTLYGAFVNPAFRFGTVSGLPLTLGIGPSLAGLLPPSSPAVQGATFLAARAAGGLSLFPGIAQLFQQAQALGPRAILGELYPHIGKDYFYGFTNVTTWDVSDSLTIKNIAGARVTKFLGNADDSPIGPTQDLLAQGQPGNPVEWSTNSAQYTEELQFQGKALNNKLSWIVGGFLYYSHAIGEGLDGTGTLLGSPAGSITFIRNGPGGGTRSQAVFAHGEYDLSDYVDGLKFSAGYRYTWDSVSGGSFGTKTVNMVTRNAAGAPTNCSSKTADLNCYSAAPEGRFSAFGWNVSLEDQLTPDTLVYVRAGNAYRPGGVNGSQVPPSSRIYQPEHVTDVELGVKTDWDLMGVHGRTNADIFHTDYKSIQVPFLLVFNDATGAIQTSSITQNAAGATIEGGEFETTVIPYKGVEIEANVGYHHGKYTQYPLAFSPLGADTPFLFAPDLTYGVTATYHLPIDSSYGDVAFSATYSWQEHTVGSSAAGEIFQTRPSFALLDVRADWTNIFGQPVDAEFFMRNALDKLYISDAYTVYPNLGFTSLAYGEPRMFGFSLKYRFKPGSMSEELTTAAYVPPPAQAPMAAPKSYLVFFDFNKSDLTPQATQIVNTAAKNATQAHVAQLTVTGHTDTVGSDAYNMRLSRRRAESVASQLEKDGIASSEIEIVAKGKRDLLVPTADGVKEPQNRRVQIVYGGGMS